MLYLLDEAFRGAGIEESNESQALLPNLRSVPDSAWHALPDHAARSIEAIAVHVGACKVMYDDHAFGAGKIVIPRSMRGEKSGTRLPPGTYDAMVRHVGYDHALVLTSQAGTQPAAPAPAANSALKLA